jgi:O-antigen/teichoic acid export membrane protein
MFLDKKIYKSISYIFISRVVDVLLSFITLAIVARGLSIEEMGVFQQYQIFIIIIGFFYFNGLGGGVAQSVARGFLGTFFVARKLSFQLSLIASFIALALFYFYDDYIYIVISLLFPFAYGLNLWAKYYEGLNNIKLVAIGSNVISFLLLSLISLLYYLDIMEIGLLVASYLLSKALVNLYFYFHIKKITKIEVEKSSIKYGIKISFLAYYNVVANNIDKFIIMAFLEPIDLAIYVMADKFPEASKSIIQGISVPLMSQFSKLDGLSKSLRNKIQVLDIILIILILLGTILLPFLIDFAFGKKYIDSVYYSQILMLSIIFTVPATINFTFIRSKLDASLFKKIQIRMSLVRVIGAVILIPLYGLNGAVMSTIIYRVLMLFIVKKEVKKYHII